MRNNKESKGKLKSYYSKNNQVLMYFQEIKTLVMTSTARMTKTTNQTDRFLLSVDFKR